MARRRRLLRPRNILLVLVLLALAWTAREIWWWATAEPAPLIDYAARLETLSRDHQPEGADGWALFVEAASHVEPVQAAIAETTATAAVSGPPGRPGDLGPPPDYAGALRGGLDLAWIEPERQALALLRERGAFDLLAEAAACPRAVRPMQAASPMITNLQLPELSRFRQLTRARVLSMRLAAEAGDEAGRLAAFEQALAVGRASAAQATLINRLVAISDVSIALRELRCELLETPVEAAAGRGLLAAMDRQLSLPPMSMAFESERLSMLDTIQYSFSDDGHGDGRLDRRRLAQIMSSTGGPAPTSGSLGGGALGTLFIAGRAETTALVTELFDHLAADADRTPVARARSGFDYAAFEAGLGARHRLVWTLLPAVTQALGMGDRARAEIAATRVMLAIEIFHAEQGRWPGSLAELVPGVLPEPPVDPTHGGPFIYRLVEDDPHGRAYVLASTGVDEREDAAEVPTDAPAGLDVFFNTPRE